MKRKNRTEGQIIGILQEHEAGAKCADLWRKHVMSEGTFYAWKAKYSGMAVSETKRLKVPVLSNSMYSGPGEPRYGMLTFSDFWRRNNVLKFGTTQSRPFRPNKLSTNPVVCLSAMPNSTFTVRQVSIAASM